MLTFQFKKEFGSTWMIMITLLITYLLLFCSDSKTIILYVNLNITYGFRYCLMQVVWNFHSIYRKIILLGNRNGVDNRSNCFKFLKSINVISLFRDLVENKSTHLSSEILQTDAFVETNNMFISYETIIFSRYKINGHIMLDIF